MENILNFEDFSTNEKKKAASKKKEKFVPYWVKNAKDKKEEGENKKEEKSGEECVSKKQSKLPWNKGKKICK